MSTSPAVWVGAILSLAAYSFLVFQDNPAFGLSEHLVVGCAAGYAVVIGVENLKSLVFAPLAKGQLTVIVPLILGALLYTKYVRRIAWMNRIPVALLVGLASGVAVRGAVQSQVLDQIKGTIRPLTNVSNLVLILGVVSVIWYFFLTMKTGSTKTNIISKIGRWVMMAAFGAGFGSTVMGRFSILVGHFQFLLYTWLGLGK